MKIKQIKERESFSNVYLVDMIPNWFEKLFGVKPKTIKVKRDVTSTYRFGGDVYINENGKNLGVDSKIGIAIDKYRRKWS